MNGRRMTTVSGSAKAASQSTRPRMLSTMPILSSSRYSGSAAAFSGHSRPIANTRNRPSRPRNEYRDSANAAIEPSTRTSAVTSTATSALLASGCQNADELSNWA